MNKKSIKFIGINTFALAFILAGCNSPNNLTSQPDKDVVKTSANKPFNSPLEGKVDFGEGFKTKASLSNVAGDATVALIYPSDNTSGKANKTVASGLTSTAGIFKINPDINFAPTVGEIFILNASKRLGGPGNPVISVQTFVKWNGTGWDSITFPSILINTKTTALTIISSYNSTSTPSADTIRKFDVTSGVTNVTAINSTDATIDNINNVASLVSFILNDSQDPVANIFKKDSAYQIRYPGSITPIPTPTPTLPPYTGESTTFNGKVYDSNDAPAVDAVVNAISIEPGVNWVGESQLTIGGSYIFRNAPVGAKLLLTVTKDGWTTRTRTVILSSNLQGDLALNVFDFRGDLAIQDEPEITSLKINGKQVVSATFDSTFSNGVVTPTKYSNISQLTSSTYNPTLSGLNSDTLEVEIAFSEPVRRDDLENYLRVSSQQFTRTFNGVTTTKQFSIDQNIAGVGFTWATDDKSVIFKTNKAILANKEFDEARYSLEFTQPFRDKTDKAARTQRYFRFSPTQVNDFAVFSVKNDTQPPALLSVLARNSTTSSDTLELRFSEPMEVINQSSVAAGLADPAFASDTTRQLYTYSTINSGNANNATILGYKNASGNFVASYVVGKITSADLIAATTTKTVKLSALGTLANQFPSPITQYGGFDAFGYRLRSARITGNSILIELGPNAFNIDDRVIVAAGTNIAANYMDLSNSIGPIDLRPNLNLPAGADFAVIQDPAGNIIDGANSTTSANISVNNQQRVSTVN